MNIKPKASDVKNISGQHLLMREHVLEIERLKAAQRSVWVVWFENDRTHRMGIRAVFDEEAPARKNVERQNGFRDRWVTYFTSKVAITPTPKSTVAITDKKCQRIGGCLYDFGFDKCCCDDGSCDFQASQRKKRLTTATDQCPNCGHPRPEPGSTPAFQVEEYIKALEKEVKRLRKAKPAPEVALSEIVKLRREQSERVMPLIGGMLDMWDQLPNDVRDDDELSSVLECIKRIDAAM